MAHCSLDWHMAQVVSWPAPSLPQCLLLDPATHGLSPVSSLMQDFQADGSGEKRVFNNLMSSLIRSIVTKPIKGVSETLGSWKPSWQLGDTLTFLLVLFIGLDCCSQSSCLFRSGVGGKTEGKPQADSPQAVKVRVPVFQIM